MRVKNNMKSFKYIISTIFLILVLSANLSGCSLDRNNILDKSVNKILSSVDGVKSPKNTFITAWNIVNDEYLDKTHNHQDWEKWKLRYIDQIKTDEDAHVAIQSMIESLNDPYTRFLPKSDFEEQDRSIEAKLYGIGVHIAQKKDNSVFVIYVIEDTPAKKAGLKAGDVILQVNNTPIKGFDLKKVADLIRGKAGTKVNLTILRNKNKFTKNIAREKISIKSVNYKILDNNYAYIRILSFLGNDAAIETLDALNKTKNAKGVILDLRGNYGGLLPNAVFIANMFIKKGVIVKIVDRNGHEEIIDAKPLGITVDKPVVVLVNGASASASEILSGALKDNKRAVLIGEKTYGKGRVQKINPLPDGSGINITIAKYLTPNGNDIDKKGIQPDYAVKLTEKDFFRNKDYQLVKAKQILAAEIKKNSKNIK